MGGGGIMEGALLWVQAAAGRLKPIRKEVLPAEEEVEVEL